jgi:dTDP-4-dehydrorhamnose 3,5-epimerase
MKISTCQLSGVLLFEPQSFSDERGWFMESFNQKRFDEACQQHYEFVQDNHSVSRAGVLRGLHYQLPPFAQGKLVRVVSGRAWDVAVDIRKSSSTFGQWFGVELSGDNKRQLWIPPGFAHGFIALDDDTQFLYKTTAYYDKASECAIRWDDADLSIQWPMPAGLAQPLINAKDLAASTLKTADCFD